MLARPHALLDTDTTEVLFTPRIADQKQTEYRKPGNFSVFAQTPGIRKPEPVAAAVVEKKPDPLALPVVVKKDSVKSAIPPQMAADKPVVKQPVTSSIFSMRDSTNYYFVINVVNNNTNLASSRFGIGQFNRVNYQNVPIKHQLLDVSGYNQLIYIGRFYTLTAVKAYARSIIPLMGDIMKITSDKYSFFIITKENLDKLADKKRLDSYIDYYQNNY
jgi:hypothetical protein